MAGLVPANAAPVPREWLWPPVVGTWQYGGDERPPYCLRYGIRFESNGRAFSLDADEAEGARFYYWHYGSAPSTIVLGAEVWKYRRAGGGLEFRSPKGAFLMRRE